MSHLNTTFEPDIVDSFLNLDQAYTPSSASPNTQSVAPNLSHQSSFANNSTSQTYAGPSFQYDAYRQQTGLPAGGLANTFAINQSSGLQHYDGQGGFVMPNETINLPLTKIEDFDFASYPSLDMNDMDFEADSPTDMPAMFYAGGSSAQFISPTTLVASNASPATSKPVPRIFPGMHQQAAQAKAQQVQKQQEMLDQQQQPIRQIPGQKPLPKGQPSKDPQVEESISRILSEMRQKSIASSAEDGDSPIPSISNMARLKKEEDDMDEDERLLASEEGKKLSSKERRQLRNKVSARAFRSRRKEYIGQLEGDLADKADEANALATENRNLREENNRLTDLTRMLLSSQAFSGFLQELSQSGVSPLGQQQVVQQQQQQQQSRGQAQTQQKRKDVNPHEAAGRMQGQQQPQVGMVLMPDNHVDMSLFDAPAWNTTVSSGAYHPQIFAVTEVPVGPVIDLTPCSEKEKVSVIYETSLAKLLPTLPEVLKSFDSQSVTDKTSSRSLASESVPSPSSTLRNQHPSFAPASNPKASASRLSTKMPSLPTLETPSERLESAWLELAQSSTRLAALLPPNNA